MNSPRVSFVVLSYNYARFIGECIASILNQEGEHDFEIIVVDDASTDDSHAVISSFDDPRIRYIRHDVNLGHAATVTDGLRAARGDLIARIDSDDRYRPGFLNEVLPIFAAHPDVAMVYGDAAMIYTDGTITQDRLDVAHGGADFKGNEYLRIMQTNFVCAPTVIARRDAWLAALPIEPGLAFHDWWFTLNIARRAPVYYRAAVLADYRIHGANYHVAIERSRSSEASTFRFLELLFTSPEPDARQEAEKHRRRKAIYGTHYLSFAQKYFYAGMNRDARRCFWQAVRRQPSLLLRADVARQFAATLTSRRMYDGVKSLMGRA